MLGVQNQHVSDDILYVVEEECSLTTSMHVCQRSKKSEDKQVKTEAHPEERAFGCHAQLGPVI